MTRRKRPIIIGRIPVASCLLIRLEIDKPLATTSQWPDIAANIAEAYEDDKKDCDDNADRIADSHRLRVVSNDNVAASPGERQHGARVCD